MAVRLYDYQIAAVEKNEKRLYFVRRRWKRKIQNSIGLLLSSEWRKSGLLNGG